MQLCICEQYLLLHCDDAMTVSSIVTGSNGDPEAKIALPPVHRCAASAVHSAREVGLDRGKMMGAQSAGQLAPIAVSTSSETAKEHPAV